MLHSRHRASGDVQQMQDVIDIARYITIWDALSTFQSPTPGPGSIFWGQGSLYENQSILYIRGKNPTCTWEGGVVEHPQGTPCLLFYTSLASGNIPDFAKQRSTTAKTGKVPAAKMRAPARTSSGTINQLMYQYNQRKPTKSWYKKYPITG